MAGGLDRLSVEMFVVSGFRGFTEANLLERACEAALQYRAAHHPAS